ncbi:HAD hydrolase-like protein [Enterococcus dispar]|uniref:HAD hydrolase, family IA n=1 Tax=Enterococcus dispar ATCC 51266 TaxID=1139219 RepID=S0JZZ4_9ENTE|nr:HAD hydrolase-like protein [Enterococcus dispar]EOT38434.1 hypothetical protein OMK_02703 [Enterococcus dispar ATCC 51266]EOW85879.1 hypothetical protein I569_01201 [Enterococcus dispar ATCC 51266]OJG38481.1 hypothetical protein RV01_GL002267 [Enterococcus dispar]
MKQNHLFFDLDGTIINSQKGIFSSIRYALKKMNLADIPDEQLLSFIGPPLIVSFKKIGMKEEQAIQAVAYYREHYREGGMFEITPYDGIKETLADLAAKKNIYLATSKPEIFAKRILDFLEFTQYFTGVYGADMDNKRGEKAEVLAYAIESVGLKSKAEAVMIGDRENDILGARKNDLLPIGVLYGFGDTAELERAGCKIFVDRPKGLLELFA